MFIWKILGIMLIQISYGEIEWEDITQFVDSGKIGFVDINSDWCVTYKLNKLYIQIVPEHLSYFREKYYCNARWLYFPIL